MRRDEQVSGVPAGVGLIVLAASSVSFSSEWIPRTLEVSGFARSTAVLEDCRVLGNAGRRGQHRVLELRYRYSVDGVEHIGTHYQWPESNMAPAGEVPRLKAAARDGTLVDVRYDPKTPTVSCLQAEGGFIAFETICMWGVPVIGLSLGVWGTALLWLHLRAIHRRRDRTV